MTIVEINITEFSKKGHGLGVTDDGQRRVEVPFTVPGDRVRASVRRKRRICPSRLEELVVPSALRIQPRCIHFASCGGCRWQQLSYEEQLSIKQAQIASLFQPVISEGTIVNPIVACDPPWHYRNKMEFSFSSDAAGNRFLGLIMDSTRGKVLNLTECHLVNPWFVDVLGAVRKWWEGSGVLAYHPHTNQGALRTLIVREGQRTGDRLVMLTVSGNPDYALHRGQLDSFVACVRETAESNGGNLSVFLRIQQANKGMETQFYEMSLYGPDHIQEILHIDETTSLKFNISPSAFFQPNTRQAERLYALGLEMVGIPKASVVYDLYCGTGTLGICAARYAKQVIGIEISPESAGDARTNAANNGMDNVKIITGSVSEAVAKLRQEEEFSPPDIIMIDPPRVGLDAATLQHIAELNPSKILYISCNPATQAQNIVELKNRGYRITAVQPVDQFPHTIHVENIVVLERNFP